KGLLQDAARFYDLTEYRGTIAAASIVLEQRLRDALATRPPERLARMPLSQLLAQARQRKFLTNVLAARLGEVVNLRNRAVHQVAEPTGEDARFVLDTVREALEALPERPQRQLDDAST